ncbi:hypothetical protein B0H16DRAFT_1897044 [Mycena metata]|uniref:No apical meristem-associated C-terminal domain-containing protein n=1 Tax=Mycena metata TaxID=1033252 RepID=A0AAD7MJ17_9AGAR|nr:hypothetical protein B0H16DRAFT_1897044 [Mycena metata]
MNKKAPPCQAQTTKKAKDAAAVATAESKEAETAPAAKKKRGRPPKKKEEPLKEEGSEDDDAEGPESEDADGVVDIDWTPELTWTLISALEEDEIRAGLFPPPGAIKRKGAKPKKHWQYLVAKECFEFDVKYGVAFTKAVKPAERGFWSRKIKNKVKTLVDAARANIKVMGQTGEGVESADDIIPGTALYTKWDAIQAHSPWFWEMRSLIGERPNLRPVGLGNNASEMDTSILTPHVDAGGDVAAPSSPDDTSDLPDQLANMDTSDTDQSGVPAGDEDEDESDGNGGKKTAADRRAKRKRSPSPSVDPIATATGRKKTKPQPGISTPTPTVKSAATVKGTKATSTKDKFSAVVAAEEATAQELLRLKQDKNKARNKVQLAQIESVTQLKLEKLRARERTKMAKITLAQTKLEHDHQRFMATQSAHAGPGPSSMAGSSRFGTSGDDLYGFSSESPLFPDISGTSDAGNSSASTPFSFHSGY